MERGTNSLNVFFLRTFSLWSNLRHHYLNTLLLHACLVLFNRHTDTHKIMNAYEENFQYRNKSGEIANRSQGVTPMSPRKGAKPWLCPTVAGHYYHDDWSRPYPCSNLNGSPPPCTNFSIVMTLAVIQTHTASQFDRSKLEQSGKLYIFIYIYFCFFYK